MNIEQAITHAARQFEAAELYFGHGTDNAWDEAAWLVLHALGLSPVEEIANPEQALDAAQRAAVETLIEARIRTRKPAAYLTQKVWFCGLPFYVDERVLVPRSPIAELIHKGFAPWLTRSPRRILDLCTGSGCIGIATAYAFADAEVVCADISADALAVAQRNVQAHGLEARVSLVESDLFAELQGRFDLIVSNPPYVDQQDMAALAAEYQQEPVLGLASGDDGLDITRRILAEAKQYLHEDGVLIVEVGNSEEPLCAAYPHLPFIWLSFDYGGHGVFMLRAEDLPD